MTKPSDKQPEPVYGDDFRTIQVVFRTSRRPQGDRAAQLQTLLLTDQSPQAALASLAAYYGEAELLATPRTLDMLVDAGESEDFAFVYFTPENIQVVMEVDTFAALQASAQNSIKGACDFLCRNVAELLVAVQPQGDEEMVRLHRVDFALAPVDADQGA